MAAGLGGLRIDLHDLNLRLPRFKNRILFSCFFFAFAGNRAHRPETR